jgi:hypothetical protein
MLLLFCSCDHTIYVYYLQHYTDAWVQYSRDTKLCRAVLHALRDYTQHMAQHSSVLDERDKDLIISKTISAADIQIGTLYRYMHTYMYTMYTVVLLMNIWRVVHCVGVHHCSMSCML